MDTQLALARAFRSLEGLSVGDAFGQLFFHLSPYRTTSTSLPRAIWPWTDDTHMALSIVEALQTYGEIEQDALAHAFARRYMQEPGRGYAGGARRLLTHLAQGADWRELSPRLFGSGSYGNGAAMRAAPIGGYFSPDLARSAQEAQRSAVVTHAHVEGQAGAIAVAVASALAAGRPYPVGQDFLEGVLPHVPESVTKQRLQQAIHIPADALVEASEQLGTGSDVSSQDTVPFCLWSAAHHLDNIEEAKWWTVMGLGDCDTTCAIVGGIVALAAPEIPAEWLKHREPLEELSQGSS
jgi:ADP-ribosylglycohydrolase